MLPERNFDILHLTSSTCSALHTRSSADTRSPLHATRLIVSIPFVVGTLLCEYLSSISPHAAFSGFDTLFHSAPSSAVKGVGSSASTKERTSDDDVAQAVSMIVDSAAVKILVVSLMVTYLFACSKVTLFLISPYLLWQDN